MDRPSRTASERIASDHIPLSVDTIGSLTYSQAHASLASLLTLPPSPPASSYSLYSFPIGTPRSPGGSGRSRPRSFVSSALDVFGGGSSLKRMESTTSKASTATTTSYLSGHSFHSFSPRVQGPNKLQRNSGSPSWYGAHGSKSAVEVGSHRMEYSGASETEDEEDDLEVLSKPFRANSECTFPLPDLSCSPYWLSDASRHSSRDLPRASRPSLASALDVPPSTPACKPLRPFAPSSSRFARPRSSRRTPSRGNPSPRPPVHCQPPPHGPPTTG